MTNLSINRLVTKTFWVMAGCGAIAIGAWDIRGTWTLDSPPAIWWFHPPAGTPGTRVAILGKGFNETTMVTFGGTRAPFTLVGPGAIRATVPAGAGQGPITVTTPMGTAASSSAFLARLWASM